MTNFMPDLSKLALFLFVVLVGVGVYFAEAYRQLIVSDGRIKKMGELVDSLMRQYEARIVSLIEYLLRKVSQDDAAVALLQAQKKDLSGPHEARVWQFQRMKAIARRVFEVIDAHEEVKDLSLLNDKKAIYDLEDVVARAATEHVAAAEDFNQRLRQPVQKWFAAKFHISPHIATWSQLPKKNP